jgi:hypothetical protein
MSHNTPLSELPSFAEYERTEEAIPLSWDFDLPSSVDTERIEINMAQLGRLQKVAAFSANHVFSFQGEVTEYHPIIQGMNIDGTAILARRLLRTSKPEPSKVELVDPHPDYGVMASSFSTDATHRLNKSEIVRVVSDIRNRTEKSNEQVWAEVLDDHLQDSIRDAARLHLLSRQHWTTRMIEVMPLVGLSLISAIRVAEGRDPSEEFLENAAILSGMHILALSAMSVARKIGYGETFLSERRWSAFMYMQPDRYLALDALTRAIPLVKVRK